jgi:phosphotransferase system  glucose/maltose/N-acetylglucosamine-specific IIC component
MRENEEAVDPTELNLRYFSKVQFHSQDYRTVGIVAAGIAITSLILFILILAVIIRDSNQMANWEDLPEKDSYYIYVIIFTVLVAMVILFLHWIAYSQFERYS